MRNINTTIYIDTVRYLDTYTTIYVRYTFDMNKY